MFKMAARISNCPFLGFFGRKKKKNIAIGLARRTTAETISSLIERVEHSAAHLALDHASNHIEKKHTRR